MTLLFTRGHTDIVPDTFLMLGQLGTARPGCVTPGYPPVG